MNRARRKRLADVREKAHGLHAALDALAEQAAAILDEEQDALDAFARRDGFDDWQAFADFFARAHRGAVVFTGDLIRWRAFEVAR